MHASFGFGRLANQVRSVAFGAGMALVASSSFALADAPVALLTDVNGVASAPPSYTELQAGTDIQLGKGSVKFVHYQTCKEVEVSGGKLTINADAYKLNGGKIVAEVDQPCPQKVKMAHTTAVAGGLVMRGPIKLTEVGTRPTLAMVGPGAKVVSAVRILEGDRQIAVLPVSGNRATWSADLPALADGGRYTAVLMNGDKVQIDFPIQVVPPKNAGPVLIDIQ